MSSAANVRLANKEQSLSGIQKRVLAAVPIQETWTRQEVFQEMARQGSPIDPKLIDGCLHDLVETGLVRQPIIGRFQRIPYKHDEPKVHPIRPETSDLPPAIPPTASAVLAGDEDPLTRIARFTANIRASLEGIDEAALALAEQVQEAKARSEKLDQLQALLKSIGAG